MSFKTWMIANINEHDEETGEALYWNNATKDAEMTNHSFRVDVVGITWEGFKGAMSYNGFSARDDVPTFGEIRLRAGDFSKILDYCVERTTSTVEYGLDESVFMTRHKTVKKWDSRESAEFFASCN